MSRTIEDLLNLGMIQRRHKSGALIGMVKSEPGTYYDGAGRVVTEEMAAECGFDTGAAQRELLKQQKIAAARAEIERQMEEAEESANAEVQAMATGLSLEDAEAEGYVLQRSGGRYFQALDPDGEIITGDRAVTREKAEAAILLHWKQKRASEAKPKPRSETESESKT